MGITNSNTSYSGLVQKYIGTAYDNMKLVADNMDSILAVDIDTITIVAAEVDADRIAAEAAATAANNSAATSYADSLIATQASVDAEGFSSASSTSATNSANSAASSSGFSDNSSGFADDSEDFTLGSESWATEDEDVPVQEFTDGVGSDIAPTVYSAKHYAAKSLIAAGPLDDAPLDGLHYGRNNGAWEEGVAASNYTGKNILINGDKSVTQRGDFTTSFAAVTSTYYVDRSFCGIGTPDEVDFEHLVYNSEISSRAIKLTANVLHAFSSFGSYQYVENFAALANKTLTYTVQIKSNRNYALLAFNGATTATISGTGTSGWQTISLTFNIGASPSELRIALDSNNPAADFSGYSQNDYLEIGQEQLELGSVFTGFEIVPPATQLANCQRYYQTVIDSYFAAAIGLGLATTTSEIYIPMKLPPMRIDQPIVDGLAGFYDLLVKGSSDNTVLATLTLNFDTALTIGQATLRFSLSTTPLIAGMPYLVNKAAGSTATGLDAEMY